MRAQCVCSRERRIALYKRSSIINQSINQSRLLDILTDDISNRRPSVVTVFIFRLVCLSDNRSFVRLSHENGSHPENVHCCDARHYRVSMTGKHWRHPGDLNTQGSRSLYLFKAELPLVRYWPRLRCQEMGGGKNCT